MAKDWLVAVRSTMDNNALDVMTWCIREDPVVPGAGHLSADTVADDLKTWLQTEIRAVKHAGTRVNEIAVREAGVSEPTASVAVIDALGTVAAGTGNLPHGVCAVVTVKTDIATRSGRGRTFMACPPYSSLLAGADLFSVSSGWWTAINTLFNKLLAGTTIAHDAIDHHYSLRVWSRKQGQSHDAVGVVRRTVPHWLRSRMTAP